MLRTYSNYIQNIHLHSAWYYKDHTCDFYPEDGTVVERILRDDSVDKRVLFIGFDASCPTEGGDIFFNTPSYQHSLFWSNWETETSPDHNRIKSCFCRTQTLLDLGLENYFDYVIIGGQTVEYLNWETWSKLRHFLKEGGYIIYPEMSWHYWGGEIINLLLNSFYDTAYDFELQRCDEPDNPIFSEIKKLVQFNSIPSYGDFCYGAPDKSYTLFLHKKIARK